MYAQTTRTTASRGRDRITYGRTVAHAVLDEAYHCHVGFVVEREPRVLPMLHVRLGETVYVHGSTGGPLFRAARTETGVAVCLVVTQLDGIVLARSQFHHSVNYRSVVAHGTALVVRDDNEKRRALHALVEKVATGRTADARPPNQKELAQTAMLALPLQEVSVKARAGGVVEDPADHALPCWAGVVPLRLVAGAPEPDVGVTVSAPAYLGELSRD